MINNSSINLTENQVIRTITQQKGIFGSIRKADDTEFKENELYYVGTMHNKGVPARVTEIKDYPSSDDKLVVFEILGKLLYRLAFYDVNNI